MDARGWTGVRGERTTRARDLPAALLGELEKIEAQLLLIHGADDHFFPAADAEALYENAPEPKRLKLIEHFGHAEDGFSESFAAGLADDIAGLLALAPGSSNVAPR